MNSLFKPFTQAVILVASLTLASPALAEMALFDGTTQKIGFNYAGLFTQDDAIASLPTGTGTAPAFNIPAWGTQGFSFTFAGGVYVNFLVYRSEEVQAGSFEKSFHPPNASYTIMHNEAAYPARATTPGPGFWNLKVGPNGFGGVQTHTFYTKYVGTVAASPGFSNLYLPLTIMHNPASLSNGPEAFDGGQRTNQTTFDVNGEVWDWDPQRNHMTGTFTGQDLFGTPETVTLVAEDNRTAMGINGTIQMIAPSIAYNYLLPAAYSGDADNPVGTMQSENWNYQTTTIDFVPEPTNLMLLGAGSLGLFGIQSLHRRRRR
jgi:hypothetical protein